MRPTAVSAANVKHSIINIKNTRKLWISTAVSVDDDHHSSSGYNFYNFSALFLRYTVECTPLASLLGHCSTSFRCSVEDFSLFSVFRQFLWRQRYSAGRIFRNEKSADADAAVPATRSFSLQTLYTNPHIVKVMWSHNFNIF